MNVPIVMKRTFCPQRPELGTFTMCKQYIETQHHLKAQKHPSMFVLLLTEPMEERRQIHAYNQHPEKLRLIVI